MEKSIRREISQPKSDRVTTVAQLESVYKNQYGEYKYYAGQVFVFKDGDIANKTMLIKSEDEVKDHDNRPYLKFRARPVYASDTIEELEETIQDWKEEDDWYHQEFGNIEGVSLPDETYLICDDPMGSGNKTVLISTKWIDNIQGDPFSISPEKLKYYLKEFPAFKNSLVQLLQKFMELTKEDVYPDYLGNDNVAIYLEEEIPNIALIDRHIVWVGRNCNDTVKKRLEIATSRFKKFLDDPMDFENIKYLANGEID